MTICLRASALGFAVIFQTGLLWAAEEPADPPGLTATLKGHTETVYAIAYSPDGRYVVTASFDKTLKLWDAATGAEIKTFGGQAGHQNLVLAAAFSSDGRLIASGASDNTAKIWDVPLKTPLREFAQGDAVNALALSPDGNRLAGAGKDGTIKIWNAADSKQLFSLSGHSGAVTGLSFNDNGQFLASSGSDKTVRIWNATNGQPVATLGAHSSAVNAVLFAPGGNAVYSAGDDGLLKSWKLPVGARRNLAGHGAAPTTLALSADGGLVATAGTDKIVLLSNFDNGQQIRPLQGATAPIRALAVSPSKALVAAGAADGRLFLWNVADGKMVRQLAAHASAVTGVAFHPNNSQVLTAGTDGSLKLWNTATPKKPMPNDDKPVKVLEAHAGGVAGLAMHKDGSHVLSGGADRTVKLWNLTNGKAERTYGPLPAGVSAVAFSRDYTQVAASAGTTVKVWNAADGKELKALIHPADVTSLSFSADKSKMATGALDQMVRVWDLALGKELQFFGQAGPAPVVMFHPNNISVISAGTGKSAVVDSLACTRALSASMGPVRGLALAPNGVHLLTASDDRTIRLWNMNNGANERTILGAEEAFYAVAVSRNGALIAAGGADQKVRLHTFADGKTQGIFKTPGKVRGLAFSPNNQTLAATCDDHSLVSWNVLFQPGQGVPAEFGKAGQAYAHADAATCVAFTTDSIGLYSGGLDKTIKQWKFASDVPVKNFGHPALVDAVAFNPASSQLATGGHDGTVRIWDVVKGQQLRQINAHTAPPAPSPVYCVAWSRDGKQLLSGSLDRSMKLWDAAGGALVREFKGFKEKEAEKGHRDGVFCVAFSPDGKMIASGSSDNAIKLWNAATGVVIRELVNPKLKAKGAVAGAPAQAHPGWIQGLTFVANGARLVSAGKASRGRGYLAMWNTADGALLYGEELPLGPIYSLGVSPNGRFLALACGPRGRQVQEANGYILKMPDAGPQQTTRAAK